MLKHCDWNYKDSATNFTNVSRYRIKTEKEYYTSYYDVFGETCDSEKDKKRMWTDYGQCWDRQSLRKDFNPDLTKSKVLHYNNKSELMKYNEDKIIKEISDYIKSTYTEHYSTTKDGFQVQDMLRHLGIDKDFCQVNAIKYLARFVRSQ